MAAQIYKYWQRERGFKGSVTCFSWATIGLGLFSRMQPSWIWNLLITSSAQVDREIAMYQEDLPRRIALSESDEWCLIQTLKGRLSGRLAHYKVRHQQRDERAAASAVLSQAARQLFETELRQLLAQKTVAVDLLEPTFEECRCKLGELCRLLDSLVDPSIVQGWQADAPRTDDEIPHPSGSSWHLWSWAHRKYPRLMALDRFLESASGSADAFNLVHGPGPHQTLFNLPPPPPPSLGEVKKGRKVVMECNELLAPSSNCYAAEGLRPQRPAEGRKWDDTRLRDRTDTVFRLLFFTI